MSLLHDAAKQLAVCGINITPCRRISAEEEDEAAMSLAAGSDCRLVSEFLVCAPQYDFVDQGKRFWVPPATSCSCCLRLSAAALLGALRHCGRAIAASLSFDDVASAPGP